MRGYLVGSVTNFMSRELEGSNAYYISRKPGHMMKDFPYMRGREKEKEKVQPNGRSEQVPRRQRFIELKSRGIGEDTSSDVSGA